MSESNEPSIRICPICKGWIEEETGSTAFGAFGCDCETKPEDHDEHSE